MQQSICTDRLQEKEKNSNVFIFSYTEAISLIQKTKEIRKSYEYLLALQ